MDACRHPGFISHRPILLHLLGPRHGPMETTNCCGRHYRIPPTLRTTHTGVYRPRNCDLCDVSELHWVKCYQAYFVIAAIALHYTRVCIGTIPMQTLAPCLLAVPSLFFMALGGNHFTPLLPLVGEHAGLVDWQTNFLLGTYVIGLIPGLLVAAALSHVYGRKPITLAGLISSIVGNLIILLSSTSVTMLYTGRFFAGLAVGIGMSVGTSWIKELSTRQWDPKATAAAGARRPSLTMTLGFGCGAA